jgi:hypothetical protein
VQKGIDSVATLATAGVTSVATGYGLSGGTITTTGTIIVDSAIVASRLRVGKVVDSLALVKQNVLTNPVTGTGTSGQVAYFNGTSSITSESNLFWNATDNRLGIGTASPISIFDIFQATENIAYIRTNNQTGRLAARDATSSFEIANAAGDAITFVQGTSTERGRFNASGDFLLNTTTDAGDYKLQVSGNAYVTGTTVLAATSGNVGVGTASPNYKLNVITSAVGGRQNADTIDRTSGNFVTFTNPEYSVNASMGLLLRVFPQSDARQGAGIIAQGGSTNGATNMDLFVSEGISTSRSFSAIRISGALGNVGIGTTSPHVSAHLDVTSTSRGFLPPRMTTTQRDLITTPAAGLVIYNTTTSKLQVYTTAWTDLH